MFQNLYPDEDADSAYEIDYHTEEFCLMLTIR